MCKKQKILSHTLQYFSDYDFLTQNDFLFIIHHIDIVIQYYYMIHNEYILFLPKSYFYVTKKIPCMTSCFISNYDNKLLKNALEDYHITVIQCEKMNEFHYFLHLMNRFHKKYPYNDFIENYIVKVGEILYEENQNIKHYLLTHYRPKEYYFYENITLPFVLYKKIQLSKIVQFISLEHYAYKKSEYMLRSFSQIAEELGAIKIHICHNYIKDDEKLYKLGIVNKSLIHKKNKTDENELKFDFTYSDHNYINLNEFLLKNKILNENKFLLSKEDFDSNIELKYLISARCKNFIEKYYTQFKSSTINNKEINILFTLKEYQMNLDHLNIISEHIETHLQIDFLNVLDHIHLIDGGNIFPLKEGYIYLKQIINQEKDFSKYIHFLKAHLHSIQNKYVYLNYDYDYIDNVMKIYHQCIELNFKEHELIEYIKNYWSNYSEWYHFTLFRDMILLGNDNSCDKIHFVTFQYMNIFKNKYNIIKKMEDFLNHIFDVVIDTHISYTLEKYDENEEDGYNSEEEKLREQMECVRKVEEAIQHAKEKDHENKSNKAELFEYSDESIIEYIQSKNKNSQNNIDLFTKIKNKVSGYTFLEDYVEISQEEKKSLFELYSQYIQYIKNKSIYDIFISENVENEKTNLFSNHLFKEKLKKNQFKKKMIDLLIKGVKGSFYYENGISNNHIDISLLSKVIYDVILYYFQDEMNNLQNLCYDKVFNIERFELIDIELLIKNFIKMISKYYIQHFEYLDDNKKYIIKKEKNIKKSPFLQNLHDSIQIYNNDTNSPIVMNEKIYYSIIQESKNIFIKFIYKQIQKKSINEKDLYDMIDSSFSISYLLTNYRKYRLFYTYDDYHHILSKIEEK